MACRALAGAFPRPRAEIAAAGFVAVGDLVGLRRLVEQSLELAVGLRALPMVASMAPSSSISPSHGNGVVLNGFGEGNENGRRHDQEGHEGLRGSYAQRHAGDGTIDVSANGFWTRNAWCSFSETAGLAPRGRGRAVGNCRGRLARNLRRDLRRRGRHPAHRARVLATRDGTGQVDRCSRGGHRRARRSG